MWIEPAVYVLTFIITTGLSVIGVIISYNLYHENQKPVLQILFYQQVFLISFFVYGIWGNIALHEIISDINLPIELNKRLAVIIPVLGAPFLLISWFMLIRFSLVLNGFKLPSKFVYIYFSFFLTLLISIVFLIQKDIFQLNDNPEKLIIYLLVMLNAFIHLVFIFPFLTRKKDSSELNEISFTRKTALFYLIGVLVYSLALCNYRIFDFISVCLSVILLFAGSIFLPVYLKFKIRVPEKVKTVNKNFVGFCDLYEISKREAEIILEICTGKTNKAIADKLFITLQTVKDHNYRIYSKVGVNSRGQLANLVHEKTGI